MFALTGALYITLHSIGINIFKKVLMKKHCQYCYWLVTTGQASQLIRSNLANSTGGDEPWKGNGHSNIRRPANACKRRYLTHIYRLVSTKLDRQKDQSKIKVPHLTMCSMSQSKAIAGGGLRVGQGRSLDWVAIVHFCSEVETWRKEPSIVLLSSKLLTSNTNSFWWNNSAIFPETFVHREDIRLCSARCNTHWWLQVEEEGISGPNWHPPDAPAFQVTLPCNLCLSTALPGGNRDVREQDETSWHIQLLCHCRPSHVSQSLK